MCAWDLKNVAHFQASTQVRPLQSVFLEILFQNDKYDYS